MPHRVKAAISVVVFLTLRSPVFAEEPALAPLERPSPASVSVQNLPLPSSQADRRGSDDYFYFHKSGVTYEVAFADLDQCRLYVLTSSWVTGAPRFVPLGANVVQMPTIPAGKTAPSANAPQYRLVGWFLAAAIVQPAWEEHGRDVNRRCMSFKGYRRYAVSRTVFEQIDVGTDAEKLARMALIASGPQPQTGEVGP